MSRSPPRLKQLFPAKQGLNPMTYAILYADPSTQREIKEDAKSLCSQLNIDPEILKLRDISYFKEEGEAAAIQEIRYKHYISKRIKHLEELENLVLYDNSPRIGSAKESMVKVPDSLRSQVHGSVLKPQMTKKMSTIQHAQVPTMSKKQSLTLPSLDRQATKRSTMDVLNFGKKDSSIGLELSKRLSRQAVLQHESVELPPRLRSHANNYHDRTERMSMDYATTGSLQVALRVPLDIEYSQGNRRLARAIFEKEQMEKVQIHQMVQQEQLQLTKAEIIAKQRRDEKRYEKQVKSRAKELKDKNLEYEGKRQVVNDQKKRLNEIRVKDLQERLSSIRIKDEKFKKDLQKKKAQHEEELFQLDLQRALDKEANKGEAELKKKKNLMEVENKIKEYEEVSNQKEEYKKKIIEDRKKQASDNNAKWEYKRQEIQNENYTIDTDEIRKFKISAKTSSLSPEKDVAVVAKRPDHLSGFSVDRETIEYFKSGNELKDRLEKSERKRKKNIDFKSKLVKERVFEKQTQVKQKLAANKQDFSLKRQELEEKDRRKATVLKEIKDAWKKDVDTVKEMRNLRRQDQQENYQRGQVMHQLYKQKLIQRIVQQNMVHAQKKAMKSL